MKNHNNDLFRIRESLSNALSYFLSRAERSAQNPVSIQRNFVVSFKSLQKQILFTFMFLLLCYSAALADNITLTGVSLTGKDITGSPHFTLVQFTVGWDNSWHTSSAPNNYDAAWVFVKYKVSGNYVSSAGATSSGTIITVGSTTGLRVGMPVSKTSGTGTISNGTVVTAITNSTTFTVSAAPSPVLSGGAVVTGTAIWEHATLNSTGHTAPAGSTITPASDGTGIFIYRSSDGSGTNTFTNTQLRWNYGDNGVADGASVNIRVFAIEMVYVPEGSFYVGSGGTENSSFTAANSTSGATVPFQITSTAPTIQGNSASSSATNLSARGSWDLTGTSTTTLATGYPTGYSAFYCMKYGISQQQYVDFLNSLTQTQATTRKFTTTGSRYTITGSAIGSYATTNPYVACNCISWSDLAAYLDWSGLRPMTELEYEKSCRGTLAPVANEYAWGSTSLTENTGITNSGLINETSTNTGNCTYNNDVSVQGPMRVGAFATSSSTRVTAGATYYGMMEMTGDLWKPCITVGNATGRLFTGTHGDGSLDRTGFSNATTWPVSDAIGVGWRGGAWNQTNAILLKVSDRVLATSADNGNNGNCGGRGVRTAPVFTPVIGQSYGGGVIFYIDGTGQHGLIAATSDQSNGAAWGCSGTLITGADGTAIGTGNQNTIDIMAGCSTAGIAARLCGDLVLGGYSDWYLPSKDELNQMYLQKTVIGGFAAAGYYWSSTEAFSGSAWAYLFSDGSVNNWDKISPMYIRAIRSF